MDHEPVCRAPFTSMHVDQFGDVRPCCQSSRVLGNIADERLIDIWRGDRLAELRAAVQRWDLSLGCEFCEWAGRGDRSDTYAARFDGDAFGVPWEGPTRLELAPSNACNLQCVMCNGDWSSSIRLHREGRDALPRLFGDAQIAEVAELAPGLDSLHLFGGEPFLMAESLRLIEIAQATGGIRCTVTTNGSVLTPRIEALLDRPGIDLVVSVDGLGATYEAIRRGASWAALEEHLDVFQRLAERHGNRVNLAHCLLTLNWWQFPDYLSWAARRGLEVYVNDVLSPVDLSLHQLTPVELAAVVDGLRDRQGEVEQLGPLWQATWEHAFAGLERTLVDGRSGGRHEMLGGGAVIVPPVPRSVQGAPGRAAPLTTGAWSTVVERAVQAEVRLELDAHLTVVGVATAGDLARFPLVDAADLVGRSSAEVRSLLLAGSTSDVSVGSDWSVDRAFEERRWVSGDSAAGERRVMRRTPEGTELHFEYWRAVPDDELPALVSAVAGGADVVRLDVDSASRLVAVDAPDLARRMGLRVDIGSEVSGPADSLEAERLDPAPAFVLDELEPGILGVELTWPDGERLVGIVRSRSDGSLVYLARVAGGPAPGPQRVSSTAVPSDDDRPASVSQPST